MPLKTKSIQRLSRLTLSGQIAKQLREDILTGKLLPNLQLNEKELALSFGVSRGPLREAMQRLIQEDLLRSEPHRGVFVAEINETDLTDIYFVRAMIETTAIRKIIISKIFKETSTQLSRISEKMDKAVRANRWKQGSELDFEFHQTFVDSVGSKRLSKTYKTTQTETRLCLHRLMGNYRCREDLAVEHVRFAEILHKGDLVATLNELEAHFGNPALLMRRAQNDKVS
jgi:DNA-binding GntR family transcriptional regulator